MVVQLIAFFLLCSSVIFFYWRQRKLEFVKELLERENKRLYEERDLLQKKMEETESQLATLKIEDAKKLAQYEEKIKALEEAENKLAEKFKAISYETLKKNNEAFFELASKNFEKIQLQSQTDHEKKELAFRKLFDPLKDSLKKLDDELKHVEKSRKGDHELMKEQVRAMAEAEKELRKETANLVSALRKPDVRGMWGEMQLKRVVEIAGMLNYCDFYEQQVVKSEETIYRPDLVVRLPGDRSIIIDAKTPFEAFIEANHTDNEDLRKDRLAAHARHMRTHIMQLGKKSYWSKFQPSPEFVVLFLPAEIFLSAALQQDPTLIEVASDQGVIIATPTTLIGLLRAVAFGWKQDQFSKNAQEICQLGRELHKRVHDMTKHMGQLGKSLSSAVNSYNKTLGSMERRVLVSARKFQEYGVAADSIDLKSPELIEQIPNSSLVVDQTVEEVEEISKTT